MFPAVSFSCSMYSMRIREMFLCRIEGPVLILSLDANIAFSPFLAELIVWFDFYGIFLRGTCMSVRRYCISIESEMKVACYGPVQET